VKEEEEESVRRALSRPYRAPGLRPPVEAHAMGRRAQDADVEPTMSWDGLPLVTVMSPAESCSDSFVPTDQTAAVGRAKRQQISRACRACRGAKAKCTETRPCSRCVRLRITDTCEEWEDAGQEGGPAKRRAGVMVTADRVERPIAFKGSSFLFSAAVVDTAQQQRKVPVDLEWCRNIMRRGLEIGYEADRMLDMLRALPHTCLQVFQDACEAIEILSNLRKSALQISATGEDEDTVAGLVGLVAGLVAG